MSSATRFDTYNMLADSYSESVYNGRTTHEIMLEEILEKFVLPNLPDKAQILDLCCGRGKLVRDLTIKGYRLTGLDGSERMLHYARENAPSAEFILDDARFFRLPPTFHAVVSTANSFSHILSFEELESTFHNVWAALVENSWFVFDLGQEQWYQETLAPKQKVYGEFTDDFAWITSSSYNPEEKIYRTKAAIFRLINESWQRLDKTLSYKAYSSTEVQSTLEKVGFREVRTYDVANDFKVNTLAGRIIYVCCKPISQA